MWYTLVLSTVLILYVQTRCYHIAPCYTHIHTYIPHHSTRYLIYFCSYVTFSYTPCSYIIVLYELLYSYWVIFKAEIGEVGAKFKLWRLHILNNYNRIIRISYACRIIIKYLMTSVIASAELQFRVYKANKVYLDNIFWRIVRSYTSFICS